MTDTTDIKALREKIWDLDEAHDLRQLGDDIIDQLEAERQQREAAEAELAALREGKEPYAYALDTNGICSYLTKNKSEAELHKRTRVEGTQVIELFTRQPKPVVVRKIGHIDHDGGEYGEYFVELTDSAEIGRAVYVIEEGEAAGIVVKDGE